MKTVASFQNLGRPIAGNFFYVDPYHTKMNHDLNQGGGNTTCVTSNDCKQNYQCVHGLCSAKEQMGRFKFPEDCSEDQCDIQVEWNVTRNDYLKFSVKLGRLINVAHIGIARDKYSNDKVDVITLKSTGEIQDNHLEK